MKRNSAHALARSLAPWTATFWKDQRGAFTVIMALCFVAMIAVVGLAVDVARWLAVRTEMQNAVDSCALGAVLELNGQSDSAGRAVSVGQYLAGRNKHDFQKNSVIIPTGNILFSDRISNSFLPAASVTSANMRFVRCQSSMKSLTTYFLGVIGVKNINFTVSATAGLLSAQSVCAIPMAMCKGGNISAGSSMGYAKGDKAVLGGVGTNGFFNWADIISATGQTGLDPYIDAFIKNGTCGALTSNGRCIAVRTGVISALDDAWNSRFGVYKSGGSGFSPSDAVPDLTGYGYRNNGIPVGGAITDYLTIRMPNRSIFQSLIPGYSVPVDVNKNYGASYRRLVVMPVVDCGATSCGNDARPIAGWACVLMLSPKSAQQNAEVEFVGPANDIASPCRTSGIAGGSSATGPMVPSLVQ